MNANATQAATTATTAATTATQATETPHILAAVSTKIPAFWPNDPELWFAQVEAQFTASRITLSQTKFNHIISTLSTEVATEVRDVILNPPIEQPYEHLRKTLLERTSQTQRQRLQKLLSSEELGDRRPTQLLRAMEQLLGQAAATFDQRMLLQLFMQRLPQNIQQILAGNAPDLSVQQVADMADRMMDVYQPQIAGIKQSPEIHTVRQHALSEQISALTAQLNILSFNMKRQFDAMREFDVISHRPRMQSEQRSRPQFPRRQSPHPNRHTAHNANPAPPLPRPASTSTQCWYHQRFGAQATKCLQPCSSGNNPNPQ
jgi:hypothetical protein